MVTPGGGAKGELHEVFLHAEWDADADEATPGETEGRDEIQKDVEAAQEEEGFATFSDQIYSLVRQQKGLPPPAWQLDSEDASIETHLRRGLLGGGAARAHALYRPAWWLEVSPNGGKLALVRDSGLTILSSADEFSSPRFDWDGPVDMAGPMGRWRRVAWNEEASILAVSDALGTAMLLSATTGRPIARIQSLLPTAAPAVDLCFLGSVNPNEPATTHVLLALSYEGVLYRHPFTIPFRAGLSATAAPPLDVSAYHPHVSCMTIHHASRLLAFGGWDPAAGKSAPPSVSLWRATEEPPYYDLVHTLGSSAGKGAQAPGLVGRLLAALSQVGGQEPQGLVLKMAFSPAGRHLAVLQASGAVTVLGCGKTKAVVAQHAAESLWAAGEAGGKEKEKGAWEGRVADVAFWNEETLILSRHNGHVSVMPVAGGDAGGAEVGRFHFSPAVTSGVSEHEGGSLVLECRRRLVGGVRGEAAGEAFTAGQQSGQGQDVSLWWLRKLLFGGGQVREVGRGPKFVRRYRLLSVCKTTVERLLQRRVEMGEYEAALKVAVEHGLDTDQVHKKAWAASIVSEAAVNNVLPRIGDVRWVLEECCGRWPDSKAAAKMLTEYGLQRCRAARSDESELDDAGRGEDLAGREAALAARLERIGVLQRLDPTDYVDPRRLQWFCESSAEEVARVVAAEEDCGALGVLQEQFAAALGQGWLQVLSAIPESCRASRYEAVLPREAAGEAGVGGVVVEGGGVAEWYVRRAREIEERSGLVDNALELLMMAEGRVKGLEGLRAGRGAGGAGGEGAVAGVWRLAGELRQAATLVYECGADVTLADLERMGSMERLRMMCLRGGEEGSLVRELRETAAPLLAAVGSEEAQRLVGELLFGVAEENLALCAEVFAASVHTEPLFVFSSCPLGGAWLPSAAAEFVPWAAAPPDGVRGRVGGEVAAVVFDPQGPGARAQAEEALKGGGGGVEVVAVLVKGTGEKAQALAGGAAGAEAGAGGLERSVCVVMATPAQIKGHCANAVARISRQRILHDPVGMVELALRCVYRCNSVESLPAMNTIYTSLPERSATLGKVEDADKYEALMQRADDLDKHLTAVEILQRYGQAKPLSFFLTAHEQRDAALAILRSMSRSKVRQQERSERAWTALEEDIAWLSEAVFPFLDRSACTTVYLEALLHANMFQLASSLIEREQEKVSEGSAAFGGYISTVLAVAREILDSASGCDDTAWRNARAILAMVPDEEEEEEEDEDEDEGARQERAAAKAARAVWSAEGARERDLMEAVQMLTDMKVELLPIQVRQVKDKMEIIYRVVAEQPGVLRESEKVLKLGQRLGLASAEEVQTVREVLARAMLEGAGGGEGVLLSEGEAEVGVLMQVGRGSIWDLAWGLAQREEVAVGQRERLAAYAMAHCPAAALEEVRRGWRELGRLQRLGPQVCAAAAEGKWEAMQLWTAGSSGGALEEGGPWAGRPRGAVVQHPCYSRDGPGGKSFAATLLDPYVQRSGSEEEVDLQALAVEETVAEGLEIMAHVVRKAAEASAEGKGKKEREEEREREGRLRRRLAAGLAQADAHLEVMALLAGSPEELLGSVRAMARAHLAMAEEEEGKKGAEERLGAGLEAVAEAGMVVSGVLAHAARGGEVPLVLGTEWWEQRLEEVQGKAGEGTPLQQLFREAEVGGADAAAWERVGVYLRELQRSMREHCTGGMPWTYRAVCEPGVEVGRLLREAVAAGRAAGRKGAMEEVAKGAEKLRGALPGEGSLSARGVRACVAAGELQEEWKKGGGAVAGGVEGKLEGLGPEERLLVAEELVRGGERGAALAALETVRAEQCEGPEAKGRVEEGVRGLRLQVDEESAKGLEAVMAGVRGRLEAAGVRKAPGLSASVGEVGRFVQAAAERAQGEEELVGLAMLVCLWDQGLGGWVHLLSKGEVGQPWEVAEYAGDGSIQGVELGGEEEGRGVTARCWGPLMRQALGLGLGRLALALRKGPARYSLGRLEEAELAEAAGKAGGVLQAHFCVLSPRAEVRERGLAAARQGAWGEEADGEEVEDLLESCVRGGLAGELEGAALLWRRPALLEAQFPASGHAAWAAEEQGWKGEAEEGGVLRWERGPYLLLKEGGAAVAVPSRRAEVLPLAVAGLCEGHLALRAGALLLECTDTHPLLRTRRSALVALQAYLLRRSGEREQRDEGAKKREVTGVREGVRERCRIALKRIEHFSASA